MGAPEVAAAVKIIPAKRTATYDVDLVTRDPSVDMRGRRWPSMRATVNLKTITLGGSSDIPKTLEAVDAIAALVAAVRAELVEQGITE